MDCRARENWRWDWTVEEWMEEEGGGGGAGQGVMEGLCSKMSPF